MKYRVYVYSGENPSEGFRKAGCGEEFEFHLSDGREPAEVLLGNYDLILLDGKDYPLFSPHLRFVDWMTNNIAIADGFVRAGPVYRPCAADAEAVIRTVKSHAERIDPQQPVIVAGEGAFVFSIAARLALSGFVHIVAALTDEDPERMAEFERRIKSFVFNLKIKTVRIGDLTSLEQTALLLISGLAPEKNKEAYELMAYFNFLSTGAVLIDCHSETDKQLSDEARRAEIFVIDEIEVLKRKSDYFLGLLKNSSLV